MSRLQRNLKLKRRLRRGVLALIGGLFLPGIVLLPVRSAEQIYFNYGPLEFSIAVEDLETFAETGEVSDRLKFYFNRLSSAQQAQLRGFLQARYQVNPITAAQFSYTSSGEKLLTEAGDLLRTASGKNGLSSIRAAMILAADNPEGITAIDFLREFPTDIRVNLNQVFGLVQTISNLVRETDRSTQQLAAKTISLAATEPDIDFSKFPNLRQQGTFQTFKQTLQFNDATRQRSFAADLFLPTRSEPSQTPVIVISNGLGARRDRFNDLAEHLASHGFAVATLDHPGSDRERLEDFYRGLYRENFAAAEFVDRPLDISFLLDELDRLNAGQFQGQLNLQQVGIFGYSFGGTTALSLAGAEIDFNHLRADCRTRLAIVNISLLYQCRALELSQPVASLRDDRVKAVYVFVPFGRSLFGPEGMSQVEIPVMWEATDQDFLTPLVIEQLPVFNWLTESDRYLAVSQGLPHARITHEVLSKFIKNVPAWTAQSGVSEEYHNALGLAFFKAHVSEDAAYLPFLSASYMQQLSEELYPISFTSSEELQSQTGN